MMMLFIEGVDRAGDISAGTLSITQQLQQRSDSAQFEVFKGAAPDYFDEIAIYDADTLKSVVGAVVVLNGYFEQSDPNNPSGPNNNIYNMWFPGQVIWLRPQTATAEIATVLSYDPGSYTLTLVNAPVVALLPGDVLGPIIFAGFISRVKDKNLDTLQNLLWDVTCVDFSKLFDAKVITDSWAAVDARYIINSFCNQFVNYNSTLDYLSYDNNTDLQAVWSAVTGDAVLPTVDSSLFIELSSSAIFSWTFAAGAAMWTGTIPTTDISDLVGVASGQPTKGYLMLWFDIMDASIVTSFKIRIGSDSSNYVEVPIALSSVMEFAYASAQLNVATKTGTPVWSTVTYVEIVASETATGTIHLNGIRVNDQSAFTLYQVQSTNVIVDYRSAQVKATDLINRLAKAFSFAWYVDYNHDLFFGDIETTPAPYQITDTSENFTNLQIQTDTSNIGNRIIINGGLAPSSSTYAQVFPADGVIREWVLQAGPSGLTILIDDGSSTLTAAAGTNSTTLVFASPHGLLVGDSLVNTSRSNVVRGVLTVVSALAVTVFAVSGQTSGDVISFFNVSRTAGEEGIAVESTVDYVYSGNNQSVRASSQTGTLPATDFIRFNYNELDQIILRYPDAASIAALKALGFGDGVFDLASITDQNIVDPTTALLTAQAQVNQFSNPVITVTFTTDQKGLRAGQIFTVNQYISRNFSGEFLIQKLQIKSSQPGVGNYKDYLIYNVTLSTTLFGWIELMEKALRAANEVGLDTNTEDITLIVSDSEEPTAADSNTAAINGILQVGETETPTAAAANTIILFSPPWQWETSVGQPVHTRWGLFEWG